jgi:hypothetical protein
MNVEKKRATVKRMEADKGQFDEVLGRMIRKNPQKTREIKHARIRPVTDLHVGRRKNPYEGPLPPDYKPDVEPLSAEQIAEVKQQREFFTEHEREVKRVIAEKKKKRR